MTLGLEHWREAQRAQGFGWLLISPVLNPPPSRAPAGAAEAV
jgi:hypothetical protein